MEQRLHEKKFPNFTESERSLQHTILTRLCHSQSRARLDQSMPYQPITLKSTLIL